MLRMVPTLVQSLTPYMVPEAHQEWTLNTSGVAQIMKETEIKKK